MIPASLAKFFWDTDIYALDENTYSTFIIERLLEYGDDEAIQWVRSVYTKEMIAQVVRTSRRLSRKTVNFWALYLGFPREETAVFSDPDPIWRQ